MKRVLQALLSPTALTVLALLLLSALVWWVGPIIAIGSVKPLEPLWLRGVLLALVWGVWLGRLLWRAWQRKKSNTALLAAMGAGPSASDKEAHALGQRFQEALQRLRLSSGRRWLGGAQYLYDLPWYMFVGAPGSGKTTALTNAGLQFLLGDAGKASVQGVGGTRNCEWWFTQDAVLIDTAGRYATQDSNREVDASAWDHFLALLRKTRPRQPINGVLLTVNVQDLLQQGSTERQQHAAQLRQRLQELQTKLGVRAPVYVLVTKADLIGGFNESFETLNKQERDQVWGFSFELDAPPGSDPLQDFAPRYQELQQRLVSQLLSRLEGERDVLRRSAIFAFPQEFAALQPLLADFLRQVVSEGGQLEQAPRLRGVYFTSGTQEGTPIDRVMGALGRSFGMEGRATVGAGARGKSFFLHDLLRQLVFAEKGLGAINLAAERRRQWWRATAFASITVFSLLMLVGWTISRSRNLAYAAEVQSRLPDLRAAVEALPPAGNAELGALPEVLSQVRDAAHAENFDLLDPPLLNGLGLYQGQKLDAAAQLAYQRLLEQALMPRIAIRLEERLRAVSRDNLENAYEALKAYVMLHTPEQFDPAALRAWIALDWDHNYARMAPEQRAALDAHLDAMLALGPPRAALPRDDKLIDATREMLVAYPLEYRVYSRLKRQYRPGDVPDFTAAGAGGPNTAQVFTRASGEPLSKGISGLYTKQGYDKFVKSGLQKTALRLGQEEAWVLGQKSDPARLKDLALGSVMVDKIRRLYFEDYIKTWDAYLADVRLVKLTGLERSLAVARILSAVDSPLAAYLRGVSHETRLVDAPAPAGALDQLANQAKAEAARLAGPAPADTGSGGPLERMVDDHFAAIQRQVTGQPAPIDETLKLFADLYAQLSAVDAAQKSKSPPPPAGGGERIKMAAAQLPDPVRGMLEQLSDAGANQSRGVEIQGLSGELKPISEFCSRAIAGRYPFASGARADVLPDDFGQFFGAGGLMDDFFQRRLGALVDISTPVWSYRPLADGSKPVAAAALAEFQRAARIRDVFFRGGGKQPALKIELRLAEIDPALKDMQLDIDQQVQKLQPGGASITVGWPSQRVASQIKLSTGGGATPLSFDGPWALFRLFDRFEVQPGNSPERFNLLMNLDGRRARLEVIATSVFNPFQLKEIKQFRCPAAL